MARDIDDLAALGDAALRADAAREEARARQRLEDALTSYRGLGRSTLSRFFARFRAPGADLDEARRAEEAWLAGLPFRVENYPACLRGTIDGHIHLQLDLRFASPGGAPSEELLQRVFATMSTLVFVRERYPGESNVSLPALPIHTGWKTRIEELPGRAVAAIHQAVGDLLVPLHRAKPLHSVRVADLEGESSSSLD